MVLVAFGLSAWAMTQGEFQPGTRRGLFSLVLVVLLLAGVIVSSTRLTHLNLPPNT
ncbi:MAG: hypothetical protein ABR598_03795 [Candidatus Dormibacteria bacterium]